MLINRKHRGLKGSIKRKLDKIEYRMFHSIKRDDIEQYPLIHEVYIK